MSVDTICRVLCTVCLAVGAAALMLELLHPRHATSSWCQCGRYLWPRSSDTVIDPDGTQYCWKCDRDRRAAAMGMRVYPEPVKLVIKLGRFWTGDEARQ